MSEVNKKLSQIFKEMSAIYRYMGASERFRTLAYGKASRTLEGLQDDVTVYLKNKTLKEIPGIGESIAEKISEYVKTGKIKKYEALKKQVPYELMEMMEVSGFGPESLKQIHNQLQIDTKEKLVKALEEGSISKLKGFGAKKVENMMRGLKLHKQSQERMLLWDALKLGEQIVDELKKDDRIIHIELAGSIRRKKETIGDIDILVACAPKNRKKAVDRFTSLKQAKTILAKGETKASILLREENRQVDLRIINEDEWGAALLYFTGSKEHNIHLRNAAKEKGMKINEYGVFRVKDHHKIAGKTEAEIYKLFGFQFIPPELREDSGEFELATRKKISTLISLNDIKGDMQMHSTWSDGKMDIDALANFVLKNYPYEYIILTDHSKSERIAGGMNEKEFMKQFKEIDAVNKKIGRNFIKKGVEVDILPDGSLDLKDDLLAQMDWVCASIHSGFKKDNTERIISACNNRYVNCIGHPAGRLIGKREGYSVKWEKVFKATAKTGTAMEINAQRDRMDLNDELARKAKEAGVMLTISTDAHSENNFAFMEIGVFIAKRAWCTAEDVLNTKSWKEVELFRNKKLRQLKPVSILPSAHKELSESHL